MPQFEARTAVHGMPLDVYLVGNIDFAQALRHQRQLAYEVADFHRPRMAVMLCEHRDLITVGRDGSRAHIRSSGEQLARMRVPVEWVGRGGGCIAHAAGQLAIYPILPLHHLGWTVGEFMRRFQFGVRAAMHQFNIPTSISEHRFGVWGNTGLLAAFGVAVRNWTTTYGAYLNVNPAMNLIRLVDTAVQLETRPGLRQGDRQPMSSLLAERRLAITMNSVRTAAAEQLAAAFGCEQFHIHASLPVLGRLSQVSGESCANV